VGDVGGGVDALVEAERSGHPVGEAAGLRQVDAEDPVGEHRERRRREAEEAGRELGVEQDRRDGAARPLEDLEVLAGGVHDGGTGPLEHRAERGDVDREGVDQRQAARPGDLHEGDLGEVRPLAVELGVDRVGGLTRQVGDDLRERGVVVDPAMRFVGDRGTQGWSPSVIACPAAIQPLVPPSTLVAVWPVAFRMPAARRLRPPLPQMT
jgi:hypothetical protein